MHTFRLPAINKLNNPELLELNVFLAIRSLAGGLVDIFLPLYLYFNGVSLQKVFLFYVILNVFNIFLTPFVSIILAKFGPKHTLLLNSPFQIAFYLLVFSFTIFNWNLFLLAFVGSLSHNFFRQGLHVQIIQNTSNSNEGKSLATIRVLQILTKALSPLIGGFLTVLYGYSLVLMVSSILILISNVPLFLTRDNHLEFDLKFLEVFKNLKWNEFWSLFGAGVEFEMNQVVWPIVLVIVLNNSFSTTGVITSVSIIFSILASYFVGKYSDLKRNYLLLAGVIGGTVFWGLRSVVNTGWQIFLVDSGFGFSDTLKNIPYDSKIYNKFRDHNIMHYMVFHQIAGNVGRVALFTLLFFFPNLILSLLLGVGGTWLYLIF